MIFFSLYALFSLGFNGTVIVSDLEDIVVPLSLTINTVPIDLAGFSPTCQQSTLPFTDYTYSVDHTPSIVSTSLTQVSPGEAINFTLSGLSEQSVDNLLAFGGRTRLACLSVDPEVVSTALVMPDTSISVQGVYDSYANHHTVYTT